MYDIAIFVEQMSLSSFFSLNCGKTLVSIAKRRRPKRRPAADGDSFRYRSILPFRSFVHLFAQIISFERLSMEQSNAGKRLWHRATSSRRTTMAPICEE